MKTIVAWHSVDCPSKNVTNYKIIGQVEHEWIGKSKKLKYL